ncbi:MAG: glycosyltransferase [Actinomycetes bacterium]
MSPDGAKRDGVRPHLLYLALGFPPAAKSCAYRMKEVANLAVERGWRVTVVNLDEEAWLREFGLDRSLAAQVSPSIKQVLLPLHRPDFDPDLQHYSWFRARHTARWLKFRRRIEQISFPEPVWGVYRAPLERALEKVHLQDSADLLMVSPAPYVTMAAAWRFHRRHGVPYVVDFRDGWSVDVMAEGEAFARDSPRGKWDARVVRDAQRCWFVNDPIRDFYAQRYPEAADRLRVVRNGWDLDSAPSISSSAPQPGSGLKFTFLGNLKLPYSQFLVLIDAWKQARTAEASLHGATLDFYGYIGAGYASGANAYAKTIGQHGANGVRYHGPVPRSEVAKVYDDSDALVLALPGGRFMTSGKVYEYMASGLPIVSAHGYEHGAADILEGYPLWARPRSLDVDALRQAVVDAAVMARSATVEQRAAGREHAEKFERRRQLESPISELEDLVIAGGDR